MPAHADISGRVRVSNSGVPGTPVTGARVHLQADASVVAITGADGAFHLQVEPEGFVVITAAVPYDRGAPVDYTSSGTLATNGATNAVIELPVMPQEENTSYVPIAAAPPGGCADCHSEHYGHWSESNHARAATDPWVLDLYSGTGTAGGAAGYVFRATHDEGETGFCATCHAPVAEAHAPGTVFLDEVSEASAREGVNCSACHSIDSVNQNLQAIHLLGKATNRFPLAGLFGLETHEYVWGPLDDVSYAFMKASYAPLFRDSLLCASCHEYSNPDTGAPGQQTYSEWLASPYAVAGAGFRACQDCHMPPEETPGQICDPPPGFEGIPVTRPGTQRRRHSFVGATDEALRAAIEVSAEATALAGEVRIAASVDNTGAGHDFPTGVSIRNALLLVSASRDGAALTQTAGPTLPAWADDDVPGKQEGDHAGSAGKGFAKILEGRINGEGKVQSPVLFIDAEGVVSDTEIPAGASDLTQVRFALPPAAQPGDKVQVEVVLLYRRAFRALYVTKGWTTTPQGGPVEIEVGRRKIEITLDESALPSTPTIPAPTPSPSSTATPTSTMTVSTPSATAAASPSTTPTSGTDILPGDANCDGRATAADAIALARAIAAAASPCGADVDGSGSASAADLAVLVELLFTPGNANPPIGISSVGAVAQ